MKIRIKKSEIEALKSDLWRCAKRESDYREISASIDLCARNGISPYMAKTLSDMLKSGILPKYQLQFARSVKEKLYIDMEGFGIDKID